MKLSRMIGTSVAYWLNLQNSYDSLIAEFNSVEELEAERKIIKNLEYKYFRDNYNLPDLPRKTDEQIEQVRRFLNVATLTVLAKKDMAVNFRSQADELSESSTIKANAMVQIAINKALGIETPIETPKFNKSKFEKATEYALTLTKNHTEFYPLIYKAFNEAGVSLIILPNLPPARIFIFFLDFALQKPLNKQSQKSKRNFKKDWFLR